MAMQTFEVEAEMTFLRMEVHHEFIACGILNVGATKLHTPQHADIGSDGEIEMSRLHLGIKYLNMIGLERYNLLKVQHRILIWRNLHMRVFYRIMSLEVQVLEPQYLFAAQHAEVLIEVIEREAAVVGASNEAVNLKTLHHIHHRERLGANGKQHLALGVDAMHVGHVVMAFLAGSHKANEQA